MKEVTVAAFGPQKIVGAPVTFVVLGRKELGMIIRSCDSVQCVSDNGTRPHILVHLFVYLVLMAVKSSALFASRMPLAGAVNHVLGYGICFDTIV